MKKIINVKGKKVFFHYDNNGELVELIIYDSEDFDISYSWLND